MSAACARAIATVVALGVGAVAAADTYVLVDGDRITGKTLFAGNKAFRIQTLWGRLVIPRTKVERVLRDGEREEVLNAPEEPPSPPPAARLVIVITGKSFWYAWDPPRGSVVDPTLRLQVRIDEEPLVTYVDARTDPEDLPRATVNTFSFGSDAVAVTPSPGITASTPETRPGRIVLKLDVPAEMSGRHRVRIAYQVNDATAADPAWRDAVATMADVELAESAPMFLLVRQDPGRTEFSGFSRRRMKNLETFRLEARPEPVE